MTTGTIIMIVCAALYCLIVILFKEEDKSIKQDLEEEEAIHDPSLGADGSIGSHGLLITDYDVDNDSMSIL
ncbi:hypothetical protein ACLG6S_16550 [Thermodesulfobacteriota bacterium B35]